ncbi:MAG TPA: HepT-like ribonuclease domain-containing protein [Gammaproteobacteria bacterium]|nr:HepT-like ribonuclease domain-containing protein [Gammaproteobacteria bacterium]
MIHGYADVDDRLVWDIVESKLPALRREIDALLSGQ